MDFSWAIFELDCVTAGLSSVDTLEYAVAVVNSAGFDSDFGLDNMVGRFVHFRLTTLERLDENKIENVTETKENLYEVSELCLKIRSMIMQHFGNLWAPSKDIDIQHGRKYQQVIDECS